MTEEYHELINCQEAREDGDLTIPRALALLAAVRQHRDYSLVSMLKRDAGGESDLECIIVDIESDEVPPVNKYGIHYRERIALCVPCDAKAPVEVLTLRKNFPVLIHQNQTVPGAPASLCLYFEPVATVTRTWTPQNFLRRIQWWLEKSARGELHPANQPVEQLFFYTKYELVFPWNFDELRPGATRSFNIYMGNERPDNGVTYFVDAITASAMRGPTTAYVELTMPPIVQGSVERDPLNLGALADILSDRGVELLAPLKVALQQRVNTEGTPALAQDVFTIILLHIPVCREEGGAPERNIQRAFIVSGGAMKLGVDTGALFEFRGKYFSAAGVVAGALPTGWRTTPVFPMEVLYGNSIAAARQQSGITDEGPQAVIVGAGSLGSAMINLWGRSGWGQWTVIDNDHVKPHNITRHVAFSPDIGSVKSQVVAKLHKFTANGASEIKGIYADACNPSKEAAEAIGNAQLVVDASTTLEFPRLASALDNIKRHVSVFITPDGNTSVLLAEDDRRLMRLRTLEAQYYRVVIQEEWGRTHLRTNDGTFWSGASCRDISAIMPYSKVMAHASTLAEQVRLVSLQPQAKIRVWHRDAETGAVAMHDMPVYSERRLSLNGLDLYMDEYVEQRLRALRTAALPNETGGILLGYYDFNMNAVVIVDGLPAPLDSNATPHSFERGTLDLPETVSEVLRRTAGIVNYIGEWHSHPPGHSASPSRDDLEQLAYLAYGMSADGLPAVQLIVGEQDLQVLQGKVPL